MTQPRSVDFELSDGRLAAYHWQNADAPRMVFAHANGFNAGTYRQMFEILTKHFDIVALDLRGHGRTRLPVDAKRHKSWLTFSNDIHAVLSQLDRPADVLSGHSLGGASMILTAAAMADPPPVITIEPVILSQLAYMVCYVPFAARVINRFNYVSERSRRRTNAWPDRKTAIESYRKRKPFNSWAEGVVEDYLKDGLIELEHGMRLSCDPKWEAATIEAQRNPMMSSISKVGSKSIVYIAKRSMSSIDTKSLITRGAKVEKSDSFSHLAPMEDPQSIANWIAQKWEESR